MTKLSVNLNAIAFLRNRRDVPWPDIQQLAKTILNSGAHGITVHPRPDQRHIRFTDIDNLANLIKTDYPQAEFNIEGYPDARFYELVSKAQPDQVTLVPDTPEQSTSDHGWDFNQDSEFLDREIAKFKKSGIRVAVFVDPTPESPLCAWELGADRIELFTGPYGGEMKKPNVAQHLKNLSETAQSALKVGHNNDQNKPMLGINAGHDLNLQNLPDFLAAVPNISEVSIGHAITADALLMGFPEAVRRYLAIIAPDTDDRISM